jgi:hypothetical protein
VPSVRVAGLDAHLFHASEHARPHEEATMADMTLGPMTRVTPTARSGRRPWLLALPGVLFVLAFLGGTIGTPNQPDSTASDRQWLDYMGARGNRIGLLVGGFLLAIAGILLIVFVTRLYQRVYAAAEDRDPLPLVAAAVAGALIAAGGALNGALPGAVLFSQIPMPTNADVVRVMTSIGYPVGQMGGMFAMALAMGTITLKAWRTGYFGRALTIFSCVAIAGAIAAFVFVPTALVLIWVLVVSVVLARRPAVAQAQG